MLRLQGSALLQHGLPEGAVAQPLQALQAVLVYCSTPAALLQHGLQFNAGLCSKKLHKINISLL